MRGRHLYMEWKCPICQAICDSRRLLQKHRNDMHSGIDLNFQRKEYICKFCGKTVFTTKSGILNHENMCASNPNRIPMERTFTKTPEFKLKCSMNMKNRHKRGEHLHRWSNPLNILSYAEQYFYDILKQECDCTVCWKNNYHVGRYMLDFVNLTSHEYFEVDGEQHYTDDGIIHDTRRTAILEQLGWHLIARIRWKDFMLLEFDARSKFIDELLERFKNGGVYVPQIEKTNKQHIKQRRTRRDKRYSRTWNEWLNECAKRREQKQTEFEAKHDLAKMNGLLRSDGRVNGIGVPTNVWEARKELILTSGVDLGVFGWVEKVTEKTGLSKRIIETTIKRYKNVFSGLCCYRKGSKMFDNMTTPE